MAVAKPEWIHRYRYSNKILKHSTDYLREVAKLVSPVIPL